MRLLNILCLLSLIAAGVVVYTGWHHSSQKNDNRCRYQAMMKAQEADSVSWVSHEFLSTTSDVPSFSFQYPSWLEKPHYSKSEGIQDLTFYGAGSIREEPCLRLSVFADQVEAKIGVEEVIASHINLSLPHQKFLADGRLVVSQTFSMRSPLSTYITKTNEKSVLVFLFALSQVSGEEEDFKKYHEAYDGIVGSVQLK